VRLKTHKNLLNETLNKKKKKKKQSKTLQLSPDLHGAAGSGFGD